MPSKNSVKVYVKDGFYHLYNRGVEKRKIFMEEQDYKMFLYFLKKYLLPPDDPLRGLNPRKEKERIDYRWKSNLYNEIKLLCYCLMPNHFHLIIKQLNENGITYFMKRLSNCYTGYFNEKYNRVGSLFQGRYKAALVKTETHFLHLIYYIHYNPKELFAEKNNVIEKTKDYPWSSYSDYLGKRNTKWIYKEELKPYFLEAENNLSDVDYSQKILGVLTLE